MRSGAVMVGGEWELFLSSGVRGIAYWMCL